MVINDNLESALKELKDKHIQELQVIEKRIKELEKSNEELFRLFSQFKSMDEMVREREEETKAKQVTINGLKEKVRQREEETKAKQQIINDLEERINVIQK
ncbi:14396_t:CDS:2 [Funneliformis geosporum]|uniref:14396_t:CDS:1 n=1 Tax=Funneliformis geosporum TaxID=1117311 RepID=A0A9W4WYK4_9GLOM|nr:14396_t:CDS:2 [Funneliformis geosporum]